MDNELNEVRPMVSSETSDTGGGSSSAVSLTGGDGGDVTSGEVQTASPSNAYRGGQQPVVSGGYHGQMGYIQQQMPLPGYMQVPQGYQPQRYQSSPSYGGQTGYTQQQMPLPGYMQVPQGYQRQRYQSSPSYGATGANAYERPPQQQQTEPLLQQSQHQNYPGAVPTNYYPATVPANVLHAIQTYNVTVLFWLRIVVIVFVAVSSFAPVAWPFYRSYCANLSYNYYYCNDNVVLIVTVIQTIVSLLSFIECFWVLSIIMRAFSTNFEVQISEVVYGWMTGLDFFFAFILMGSSINAVLFTAIYAAPAAMFPACGFIASVFMLACVSHNIHTRAIKGPSPYNFVAITPSPHY